ncbi:heat-inducible transcriptional repressor HrcA [Amaricoccus tamworthensis]|uniref:heat-inducible transcriptional repressor HrcA n=1 Tax=Amaricoccus tamworthensis TaxID=57002 RepID=UPI003C7E3974
MNDESPLGGLNERSREVFRRLVETYLDTGGPVGSKTLTGSMKQKVSSATIRNVMQDLEMLGLLDSPHVSAGRVPTQRGLRLFVDGFMEVGDVNNVERAEIEKTLSSDDGDLSAVLDRAGDLLSGMTHGASLVLTPKTEAPIKHIEFVSLGSDKALVVLVTADGQVENRLFSPPPGMTPSTMQSAANFLNNILVDRTLSEMRSVVAAEIARRKAELDQESKTVIESGLAVWSQEPGGGERLIVRGRSNLLEATDDEAQLEKVRELFDELERKRDLAQLLELSESSEGVRVFIGSENKLFSLSGSSLVVSPYMNADRKIIGAVGVIGPTRLNYGRIVPIVDYTAQLVGRLISGRPQG